MSLTITEILDGESVSVTATEGLAITMVAMQNTIANSKIWQAMCGEGNASKTFDELVAIAADPEAISRDDALNQIRMYCFEDEGPALTLPSCLICHENNWLNKYLGPGSYEGEGSISLAFAWPVAEAYLLSRNLWYIDALNKLFAILKQLQNQEFVSGLLPMNNAKLGRVGRLDPAEFNNTEAIMGEIQFSVKGLLT